MIDTRKCLICNGDKKHANDTIYWHQDKDTGDIWAFCNKCDRGYGIRHYCHMAEISLPEFLKGEFDFIEAASNEITRMEWPQAFVPLSDFRAKDGLAYLKQRGLSPIGDMYYDIQDRGIVFPYYYDNVFCGAQVRFLKERVNKDGDVWKITTMPGTRLGLVIYAYNQTNIMPHVKGFIVTEGAFNALSIQQSLDKIAGGAYKSPWKAVACSGSGGSIHQLEVFKELIGRGYKVVCAPDNDEAGLKMFKKYVKNRALTHFALTDDANDWNSVLQKIGHDKMTRYFFERVKKVQ